MSSRLIIFDMDGTLVDSQFMIVAAMEAAFAAHALVMPPREDVLGIVGLSLETAMARLGAYAEDFPSISLAAAYREAFFALRHSPAHQEPLFPGILEVLDALGARSDVTLALATGKSRRGVDAVLGMHGLLERFVSIQTADDAPSKPDPGMVLNVLAETGMRAEDTLVIGDTTFDMEMARAAGARGVGVTWGYHKPEALRDAGAAVLVTEADQLIAAIDELLEVPVS